jgi:DNA invertase Pin-like site-specific DNA recombinase
MPEDDVTLGELIRRLDALHRDVREVRTTVNTMQMHEVHIANLTRRIDSLESMAVWVVRSIIGLVITAVIGGLIVLPNVT